MKVIDKRGQDEPIDTTPPAGVVADPGRPVVVDYMLGIQVVCDKGRGGCGQELFLASPQMIQGALVNGQFQGPCPSCHAHLVMRPKQTIVAVPAQAMQQLNRQQRRALGKGNGHR